MIYHGDSRARQAHRRAGGRQYAVADDFSREAHACRRAYRRLHQKIGYGEYVGFMKYGRQST